MPPPATLPSLKAEHGQDPTIAIVPQGGTGWIRSSEDPSNKQNGSSSENANAPDLRPTWAKPPSGSSSDQNPQGNIQNPASQVQGTAAQVVAGQAPPNNRDFPSLAASVAAAGKDTSPLKPQKTNAWGTNLEDAQVEIPPIPVTLQQSSTGGYIGASTAPKSNVERKLPERYFSSTTSVATVPRAGKANIREKLARLSIDSKEASIEQEVKQEKEESPTPVQPVPQQVQGTQNATQQKMSQDVRQIHGQAVQAESQQQHPQDWQQQNQEGYYEYDRHHTPGRGDGGYDRRYPPRQQFQRFDEPLRQQQYRQDNMPIDDVGWNQDDMRNNQMRPNPQNRYRMDSRSSNEADNWQNYNRQNRMQGWYDNSGYPVQHDFQGNHNFQNYQNQNYRRHDVDYGNYNEGQNFHKNDNQGFRNPPQGPQRAQQPEMPYRMLKRNDEKSAEYIAHHGGAVVPQNSQEQEVQKKKKSKKVEEEQEGSKPMPPENVWEKRMEERKKEEKSIKNSARYQQELDYNFPSINENPKDEELNEWGAEQYGNNGQRKSQKRNGQKSKGDGSSDVIGSTHWVQQQTGPSWDNLTIPADHRIRELQSEDVDDDVYTGTKREFVNSKRGKPNFKPDPRKTKSAAPRGGGQITKKPKNFDGKRRHDDNFSNMGEFHADDYKFSEDAPQRHPRHRDSDSGTHDDNSFDGSRRGSKRIQKNPRVWKKNGDEQEHENGETDYSKNKKAVNSNSTRGGKFGTRNPKIKKEDRKPKGVADRNIEGIKSPVISEGIDDEWETASESSDFVDRIKESKEKKVKKKMNGTAEEDKQEPKPIRAGQKNVKPASHTFQGSNASGKNNVGFKSSNANSNSHQLSLNKKDAKTASLVNARDSRKAPVHKDGLAGVDINDASVIVIDNQPDIGGIEEGVSEADFEEVMSKKQKKQKQLQLEEERKKEIREKEKAERQQLRKSKITQKKVDKKSDRKSQEKSPCLDEISVSTEEHISYQKESSPAAVEPDLGTSVWNSVRVLPAATTVIEEKQRTHIPSPIARPTKPQQSATVPVSNAMNIDVNPVKDEYSTFGVTKNPVATTPTALYDIQSFDPKTSPIGTKPIKTVQKPESEEVMSSDHAVLKEKLDKVKDFWPGDDNQGNLEKNNLSQAHGPNVAKVKPQPQLQDQQQQEKTKQNVDSCIFTIPQAQSPNLYHPNQMFQVGQTSPFGHIQNPNYQIIYGTNEYMQYSGHQNSPPSHSVFGGQLGLMTQTGAVSARPPQNSYDGAVFGGLWSNGGNLDFLTNNQNQGNRYQFNTNSRTNSGQSINNTIHPTNIPPPSINFNQQGQIGTFVPTHIPPPPITQYQIGPFTSAPTPPIGNNRSNGTRFPMQQNANFRQPIPQGAQQYGFQPMNRPGSGSNQRNNGGFQNPQNQRGSPNWQKNNQQNYGGYYSVKYGASQSTA